MNKLTWRTADELGSAYRSGTISPVDAVEASIQRIEAVDGAINSMVTVTADEARASAIEAEKRLQRGEELPPLFGIPVTVKDLTDTAGVRTTYGCQRFANHIPDQDALAWARLKQAGAILIGKTTTPEFGLLGITDSMLTGRTSTPWKIGHNSGGSSGGAAASVSAGIVPLGWGSDGGGSIRVPAALCGVVGIKPTTGMIPHLNNDDADTTDGPIARTVLDAAIMLDATAGHHPRDRFTFPLAGAFMADAARRSGDLSGLRIAASADLGHGSIDPEVRESFETALEVLRNLGATVSDVVPQLPNVLEFFVSYWGPECVVYLDEMDSLGQPVWTTVRRMAEAARKLSPMQVSNSMRGLKTELYNGYADVFDSYDAIVTPTTPFPAFPHPDDAGAAPFVDGLPINDRTLELHRLTEPPAHAGLPAISVPSGFTASGLPLGLQVMAPMYEDALAIFIASRYEQATQWHTQHPSLASDNVPTV